MLNDNLKTTNYYKYTFLNKTYDTHKLSLNVIHLNQAQAIHHKPTINSININEYSIVKK